MPQAMPNVSPAVVILLLALFLSILAAWIGLVLRLAFGLPIFPARTPQYVPWGVGSVIFTVFCWFGLQLFVPTIYLLAAFPRMPGMARHELSPSEQMSLSAMSNALVLILIPLGLFLMSGARLRDYGLVAHGLARNIGRGLVAYPLLVPIVFGAMFASLLIWNKTPHPLEDALRLGQNPRMVVVLVLAAVVFAPLSEELIFRGVLLGWLTRLAIGRPKDLASNDLLDEPVHANPGDLIPSDPGFDAELDRDPGNPYTAPVATVILPETVVYRPPTLKNAQLLLANVVVSVIFAGLHAAAWPTPIPIFFLSMGLGMLYQRTGSLIPSMVLHMTFNGVSTVLMLLTLGNPPPDAKKDPQPPAAKAVPKAPAMIVLIPENRVGSHAQEM